MNKTLLKIALILVIVLGSLFSISNYRHNGNGDKTGPIGGASTLQKGEEIFDESVRTPLFTGTLFWFNEQKRDTSCLGIRYTFSTIEDTLFLILNSPIIYKDEERIESLTIPKEIVQKISSVFPKETSKIELNWEKNKLTIWTKKRGQSSKYTAVGILKSLKEKKLIHSYTRSELGK